MRIYLLTLCLLTFFIPLNSHSDEWFIKKEQNYPKSLGTVSNKRLISTNISFPGNYSLYILKSLYTLRPKREDFLKKYLCFRLKFIDSDTNKTKKIKSIIVKIFVQDKDGFWFQSRKKFTVEKNKWATVAIDVEKNAKALLPYGHNAVWYNHYLLFRQIVGIVVSSGKKGNILLFCKKPYLAGKRTFPKLKIIDWYLPKHGETFKTIESRFNLSREYFNPFDPKEIEVNFEVEYPQNPKETSVKNKKTIKIWPAFFNTDFFRKKELNREKIMPEGEPFWTFRFCPTYAGKYKIRLLITDNSDTLRKKTTHIESPWKTLFIKKGKEKGTIKRSKSPNIYFCFSDGNFFYPIGFNIHSIVDLRARRQLNLPKKINYGTFTYDEYFKAMSKHGLNAVELWMSAWGTAIEWTCRDRYYYGLGRYNLANAWKLDYLVNLALKHKIYIHLILDNHGKLAVHCDPEWYDSPYNKNRKFAIADGGFLSEPIEYFTDEKAIQYNKQRYRYIAARWSAYPNIFGLGIWSEVDLVKGSRTAYNNNTLIEWHKHAVNDFERYDQLKHLCSTHVCSDYRNTMYYKKLYELPEISYVISDAYRPSSTPFIEYLKKHSGALSEFKKPQLITEYGGTHMATSLRYLEADLHAGIWSSIFLKQAGTPFLWWHEFIHTKNKYFHFDAFAKFIKELNPIQRKFTVEEKCVFSESPIINNSKNISFLYPYEPNILIGYIPKKEFILKNYNSNAKTYDEEVLYEKIFFTHFSHNMRIFQLPGLVQDRKFSLTKAVPSSEAASSELQSYNIQIFIDPNLGGFVFGDKNEKYGWIYDKAAMKKFPVLTKPLPVYKNRFIILETLKTGDYKLQFFDTLTGKIIKKEILSVRKHKKPVYIKIPGFKIDIAFKIRPLRNTINR